MAHCRRTRLTVFSFSIPLLIIERATVFALSGSVEAVALIQLIGNTSQQRAIYITELYSLFGVGEEETERKRHTHTLDKWLHTKSHLLRPSAVAKCSRSR